MSRLREAGVRVVSRKQSGLMHHKFAVVDGRVVITGSFNWTSQVVSSRHRHMSVFSPSVNFRQSIITMKM